MTPSGQVGRVGPAGGEDGAEASEPADAPHLPDAVADPWWSRPLPPVVWGAGVLAVLGWIVVRLVEGQITQVDRVQQYQLVEGLASGRFKGSLRGLNSQASPPGYGFFALPFHLVFERFAPTHNFYVPNDGWYVAGYAALLILAVVVVLSLRAVGVPRRSATELIGLASAVGGGATLACYTESYHPSDVLATACTLLAGLAVLRQRWAWAAAALGFGLLCKQWVIVPIAVLAALSGGRARVWLVAGSGAIFAAVVAPFLATDRQGTMEAIRAFEVGPTSRTIYSHITVLLTQDRIGVESRIVPLVVVAGVCVWLIRARPAITPELVFGALAATMLVRPLFDAAGYAYYAAPGLVLIAVFSRDWRWPIASLVSGVVINAMAKRAYLYEPWWPAAVNLVLILALVLATFARLHRLVGTREVRVAPA